MFKKLSTTATSPEQFDEQKERLDEVLKTIDGLIFSIKMETYQSIMTAKSGNGNKAFEYTPQEMMAKKNILFSLIPADELYAITKKKSASPRCS